MPRNVSLEKNKKKICVCACVAKILKICIVQRWMCVCVWREKLPSECVLALILSVRITQRDDILRHLLFL